MNLTKYDIEADTLEDITDSVDDLASGFENVFEQFEAWLNQPNKLHEPRRPGAARNVARAKIALVGAGEALTALQAALATLEPG